MSAFYKGLSFKIPDAHIETREDMSYISWATAVALAGRPYQEVVTFGGKPVTSLFGGVLVAVDMKLNSGKVQRTYLHALDNKNNPMAGPEVTARDITDTIARCRAKAIAMVTGYGISLYAGYQGNGPQLALDLGLTPTGDPAGVKAITSEKKITKAGATVDYLDWAVALSAARITDEDFHWEVKEHEFTTADGEIKKALYLPLAKGFLVAVTVNWKGILHTEMLPIMGKGNAAISQPTSADWNKSVMRCLAKAIAVVTGYGLSIYAKEDLCGFAEAPEPEQAAHAAHAAHAAQAAQAAQVAIETASKASSTKQSEPQGIDAFFGDMDNAKADLVIQVADLIREKNRSREQLLIWLGHPSAKSLESLPEHALRRALSALQSAAVKVSA